METAAREKRLERRQAGLARGREQEPQQRQRAEQQERVGHSRRLLDGQVFGDRQVTVAVRFAGAMFVLVVNTRVDQVITDRRFRAIEAQVQMNAADTQQQQRQTQGREDPAKL